MLGWHEWPVAAAVPAVAEAQRPGSARHSFLTTSSFERTHMPTIIVQTGELDRVPDGATLVERIIPSELHSEHYLEQLVERLGWALADADTST